MFEINLFLHLTGLAVWFGSLLAMAVLLPLARSGMAAGGDVKVLVRKGVRVFGWLAQPSSIIVLVSGILMIVQMDWGDTAKPLWLTYMERGGGTIILVAVVLTAWLGGRTAKRLGAIDQSPELTTRSRGAAGQPGQAASGNTTGGVAGYTVVLFALLAAIVSVILVVSLRL